MHLRGSRISILGTFALTCVAMGASAVRVIAQSPQLQQKWKRSSRLQQRTSWHLPTTTGRNPVTDRTYP